MPAKRKAATKSPKAKNAVQAVESPGRKTRGAAAAQVDPAVEEPSMSSQVQLDKVAEVKTGKDESGPASKAEEELQDLVGEEDEEKQEHVEEETQEHEATEESDISDHGDIVSKDEAAEELEDDSADENFEREGGDDDKASLVDAEHDDEGENAYDGFEDNVGSDYAPDEVGMDEAVEEGDLNQPDDLDSKEEEMMDEQEELDDSNEVGEDETGDEPMDDAEDDEPHDEKVASLEDKEKGFENTTEVKMDDNDMTLEKQETSSKVEPAVTLTKDSTGPVKSVKSYDSSADNYFMVRFRVTLDNMEELIPHLHDYYKMETNIHGSFSGNKVVTIVLVYANEHKDQIKALEELKIDGKILANFSVQAVNKPAGLIKVIVSNIPKDVSDERLKAIFQEPSYVKINPIRPNKKKNRTVTLGFLSYTEANNYVEKHKKLLINNVKVNIALTPDQAKCNICHHFGHTRVNCTRKGKTLPAHQAAPGVPRQPLQQQGPTRESDHMAQQMVRDIENRMAASMTQKIMAQLSERGHDTSREQLAQNLAHELRQMTDNILQTSNIRSLYSPRGSLQGQGRGRGSKRARGRGGARPAPYTTRGRGNAKSRRGTRRSSGYKK